MCIAKDVGASPQAFVECPLCVRKQEVPIHVPYGCRKLGQLEGSMRSVTLPSRAPPNSSSGHVTMSIQHHVTDDERQRAWSVVGVS